MALRFGTTIAVWESMKDAIYLGKCKACGKGARLVNPTVVGSRLFANGYHGDLHRSGETLAWSIHGGAPAHVDCACGATFKVQFLRGKVCPEKVCNGKCMASHGPVCECACGGKNHGASYAA